MIVQMMLRWEDGKGEEKRILIHTEVDRQAYLPTVPCLLHGERGSERLTLTSARFVPVSTAFSLRSLCCRRSSPAQPPDAEQRRLGRRL